MPAQRDFRAPVKWCSSGRPETAKTEIRTAVSSRRAVNRSFANNVTVSPPVNGATDDVLDDPAAETLTLRALRIA
jgi:hypothetical protein